MKKKKIDDIKSLLDLKTLGGFLRQLRKNHGYKNADEFANALGEKAGYYVSGDTVWRIEAGRTEPTISYICAVGLITGKKFLPQLLNSILYEAACPSWRRIVDDEKRAFRASMAVMSYEEAYPGAFAPNFEDFTSKEEFESYVKRMSSLPDDFSDPYGLKNDGITS